MVVDKIRVHVIASDLRDIAKLRPQDYKLNLDVNNYKSPRCRLVDVCSDQRCVRKRSRIPIFDLRHQTGFETLTLLPSDR